MRNMPNHTPPNNQPQPLPQSHTCGHDHAHNHTHSQGHNHSHCAHTPTVNNQNKRLVFWVMIITGTFMVVEALGGFISGSLALLADAGHMLTDTAALFLAWLAFYMAAKPADTKRSYGYKRFQIIAAFANGITLFGIALWIVIEAAHRLISPAPVDGIPMIAVASLGLVVNIIGFWLLSRADQSNLNIRGAALHVLGDLLGSVAAIIAALIILMTGWTPIDPILSVLVCALILRSAYALIRQSAHILLQGTPADINTQQLKSTLENLDGVTSIHDLHLWALTDADPIITLHAVILPTANPDTVLGLINQTLKSSFNISHSTIQIERSGQTCPNPCAL